VAEAQKESEVRVVQKGAKVSRRKSAA
jgi:hypothetical protein